MSHKSIMELVRLDLLGVLDFNLLERGKGTMKEFGLLHIAEHKRVEEYDAKERKCCAM